MVRNAPVSAEVGSILGQGRSPGEGSGNSLQDSGLKIPWTEEPGRPQSMGLPKEPELTQLLNKHCCGLLKQSLKATPEDETSFK